MGAYSSSFASSTVCNGRSSSPKRRSNISIWSGVSGHEKKSGDRTAQDVTPPLTTVASERLEPLRELSSRWLLQRHAGIGAAWRAWLHKTDISYSLSSDLTMDAGRRGVVSFWTSCSRTRMVPYLRLRDVMCIIHIRAHCAHAVYISTQIRDRRDERVHCSRGLKQPLHAQASHGQQHGELSVVSVKYLSAAQFSRRDISSDRAHRNRQRACSWYFEQKPLCVHGESICWSQRSVTP